MMCGNGRLTAIDGMLASGIVPAFAGLLILILYMRRKIDGRTGAIAYAAVCYAYWAVNLASGIPSSLDGAAAAWLVLMPIVVPATGILLMSWISRWWRRWNGRRANSVRGFAVVTKQNVNQLCMQAERWPRIIVKAEPLEHDDWRTRKNVS